MKLYCRLIMIIFDSPNTSLDFNRLMSEQCRMFIDTIQSKILIKEKIAAWA
jgi:hypothetical protein